MPTNPQPLPPWTPIPAATQSDDDEEVPSGCGFLNNGSMLRELLEGAAAVAMLLGIVALAAALAIGILWGER